MHALERLKRKSPLNLLHVQNGTRLGHGSVCFTPYALYTVLALTPGGLFKLLVIKKFNENFHT